MGTPDLTADFVREFNRLQADLQALQGVGGPSESRAEIERLKDELAESNRELQALRESRGRPPDPEEIDVSKTEPASTSLELMRLNAKLAIWKHDLAVQREELENLREENDFLREKLHRSGH